MSRHFLFVFVSFLVCQRGGRHGATTTEKQAKGGSAVNARVMRRAHYEIFVNAFLKHSLIASLNLRACSSVIEGTVS